MIEGISIREFARRADCDEKVVRRKVKTGHLPALSDGTIDPAYLAIDWRKGDVLAADSADTSAVSADTETDEQAIDRIMGSKGRHLWSKAEAERVKENYAALLRQLEFGGSRFFAPAVPGGYGQERFTLGQWRHLAHVVMAATSGGITLDRIDHMTFADLIAHWAVARHMAATR